MRSSSVETVAACLAAVALLLPVAGCGDESETPLEPLVPIPPTLASATALSFRQVSAGSFHSCGVTENDRAYCWGLNNAGQLGDGTRWDRPTPALVIGGLRFRSISAGAQHTCAVTTDGRGYCWGDDNLGHLGTEGGSAEFCDYRPCSTRPLPVAGGRTFLQMAAGGSHTCALAPDGNVYCWGFNSSGQLGDETVITRTAPVLVLGPRRYRQVTAGSFHSCGVSTTNLAFCWGGNEYGQLGDSTEVSRRTRAVRVAGGYRFRQVDAGLFHTCGVTADYRTFCWGDGRRGELGNGSTYLSFWPRLVLGEHSFERVTAGGRHTCAETTSNRAYCWGWNPYGQVGDGNTGRRLKPWPVSGGLSFTQLTTGGSHTCGIAADRAYCWGRNREGELGDGTSEERLVPTRVAPLFTPSRTTITGTTPEGGTPPSIRLRVSFTVTAASGAPTGTVTVTSYYSETSCQANVTVGSCTLDILDPNARELLTASYNGDGTFAQSTDTLSYYNPP